jgi:hypothetical protein
MLRLAIEPSQLLDHISPAMLELILSEMDVAELVHNFPAVWAAASPLSHRPADVRLTHDARPPIALAR